MWIQDPPDQPHWTIEWDDGHVTYALSEDAALAIACRNPTVRLLSPARDADRAQHDLSLRNRVL